MIGVRKTSLFWIVGQLIWEWIRMIKHGQNRFFSEDEHDRNPSDFWCERQEHSGKWVGSLRVTHGSGTTRSADTKETWGSVIPFSRLSQLQLGYNWVITCYNPHWPPSGMILQVDYDRMDSTSSSLQRLRSIVLILRSGWRESGSPRNPEHPQTVWRF